MNIPFASLLVLASKKLPSDTQKAAVERSQPFFLYYKLKGEGVFNHLDWFLSPMVGGFFVP